MSQKNVKQSIGFSSFLTGFEEQKELLAEAAKASAPGLMLFTSLHVYEEITASYRQDIKAMCECLTAHNFRIIADVSKRSLEYFGVKDLTLLAEELGLWALRPDYGFEPEEIKYFSRKMPLVVNATTTPAAEIAQLKAGGKEVFAMHNYYPRPETGLDPEFFNSLNEDLRAKGIEIMAFIPGDCHARQPLGEGLPTLEHQRKMPPSVAYAEMLKKFSVDHVFLGDPGISKFELKRIQDYAESDILAIPSKLEPAYEKLYEKVFTYRVDSPSSLIRFAESREYAVQGARTEVGKTVSRPRGSITIDNENYQRYSGEIQVTRQDFPADPRVNLIGSVDEAYLELVDCVPRGAKFKLVKA